MENEKENEEGKEEKKKLKEMRLTEHMLYITIIHDHVSNMESFEKSRDAISQHKMQRREQSRTGSLMS
jgi:hypothetical protein